MSDSAAEEYERILRSARIHIQESMAIYRDMLKRHQAEYEQIEKANREAADQLRVMLDEVNRPDDDMSYLDD